MSEERALFRAKPHWFYLAWPGVMIILGISAVLAGYYYLDDNLLWVGGALLAIALLVLMVALLHYRAWNLYVTNRRLILKSGLFARSRKELHLRQIESVFVDARFLGRVFKYGTVMVIGLGGTRLAIKRVNRPDEVHQHIQRALTFPQPAAEFKLTCGVEMRSVGFSREPSRRDQRRVGDRSGDPLPSRAHLGNVWEAVDWRVYRVG